jgi:hypothetical protein
MFVHFAMKDTSPAVRIRDDAVENSKRVLRNSEEFPGNDGLTAIVEKICPSLCRVWVYA